MQVKLSKVLAKQSKSAAEGWIGVNKIARSGSALSGTLSFTSLSKVFVFSPENSLDLY